MRHQSIVVGLGQFGLAVVQALAEKGSEVIAVDRNRELVHQASSIATEAIQMDASDEDAMARLEPKRRDLAVCAIGDDSREQSILCTALLRQQGAPRIVARSSDPLHTRILRLVGAHVVVNPEREFGIRLANRLMHAGIVAEMPLGENLHITELRVPEAFAGRTLAELALPKRHRITVVGVRHGGGDAVALPEPHAPLAAADSLLVVSEPAAVSALLEEVKK